MNSFIIDKPGRYRTRNGNKALIFLDDGTDRCPIVGAHEEVGIGYCSGNWGRDGKRFSVPNEYHELDIVEYLGPLQPGDDGFNTND